MEEFIYYNNLYDCYNLLLTEKQRKYFEEYYFNNLSLSEIAGISIEKDENIKKVLESLI